MGGKNPAIVTASADLDAAAEGIARSAFGLRARSAPPARALSSRTTVYDEFMEKLAEGASESRSAIRAAELVRRPGDQQGSGSVHGAPWRGGERGPSRGRRGRSRPAGPVRGPTVVADLPHGHRLDARRAVRPVRDRHARGLVDEAIARRTHPSSGSRPGMFSGDEAEKERFLDEIEAGVVYVNRGAGATTGAWPGSQTFGGWKSSGSTGKGGLGAWYLPQFMREQSRTIVE